MTPRMKEALSRREPRLAEREARWQADLAKSKANGGKVALPPLADVTAKKEAAVAELAKLAADVSKEADETKKAELAKLALIKERDKAEQESLERLAKGIPTKADLELQAKLQANHDAKCASQQAWLAKRDAK